MRIVAWNCAGAFHRKWQHIAALRPDIAIIAEACVPERVPGLEFTSAAWVGRLFHKGLAVLGFGDWHVEQQVVDEQLEWVLPVRVTGPDDLLVVGVWAMNHRAKTHPARFAGIRQPCALVDLLNLDTETVPVVVAGDFNNHPRWDTPRKPSFRTTRERLERAGLVSLYHVTSGEAFGSESIPTHWWRDRSESGPTYHIDYAWVSAQLAEGGRAEVGGFADWVTGAGSDHAALIIDVQLSSREE